MARSEQHRLQLDRLRDVTDRLRRGQRVTARELAREWSCSMKTVYRDIEYLRDRQHAPIEYDQEVAPMSWRTPAGSSSSST